VRRTAGLILVIAVGSLLAGCADMRQQAQAVSDRLSEAEAAAQKALDVAAENAVRIRNLEGDLERLWEALNASPEEHSDRAESSE